MKSKVGIAIFTFLGFCLIFLFRNDWSLTNKQIAEMIVLGVGAGIVVLIGLNPTMRFIERTLRK
jgi:hypothetical protein